MNQSQVQSVDSEGNVTVAKNIIVYSPEKIGNEITIIKGEMQALEVKLEALNDIKSQSDQAIQANIPPNPQLSEVTP